MDKLTATRCCARLSYLNTLEHVISLLNIALLALSLTIDPNVDDWLLKHVINNIFSMKSVKESIKSYDIAYACAITILERRIKLTYVTTISSGNDGTREPIDTDRTSMDATVVADNNNNNNGNITSRVGNGVVKFSPGHGKFSGTVIQINESDIDGKHIRVRYEDGEEEDYFQDEVDEFQRESSIPIGCVGFRFVKRFRGAGVFSGKVIKILQRTVKNK